MRRLFLPRGHIERPQRTTRPDPLAMPRAAVLSAVAALEGCSSHPLASAIVATARSEGVAARSEGGAVSNYVQIEGEGLSGRVGGRWVHVGNARMAARMGWLDGLAKAGEAGRGLLEAAAQWEQQAETVCWVGLEGELVAVLGVADKVWQATRQKSRLTENRLRFGL
jgi:cation transport ATPase